ncbi:MAG: hypothetical protein L6R42_001294 [Xanthoria sp. 1 TBL-2021]|nr:MAG: hypothetical protein L6R42_001294 [Xanthoria sp. 1 TBL-2021]
MLLRWGPEYLEKVRPPHLLARIKETRGDPHLDTQANITPIPYVDAYSGKLIAEVPMEGTNLVSRAKLRRFFAQGENLNIQFGKTIRTVDVNSESVSVTSDNGTTETGAIAVGCDGSHSIVREFLVWMRRAAYTNLALISPQSTLTNLEIPFLESPIYRDMLDVASIGIQQRSGDRIAPSKHVP